MRNQKKIYRQLMQASVLNIIIWSTLLFFGPVNIAMGQDRYNLEKAKYPLIPYEYHREEKFDNTTRSVTYYRNILDVGINSMNKLSRYDFVNKLKRESNIGKRINALVFLSGFNDRKSVYIIHETLIKTIHPTLKVQCINALVRLNDNESTKYIEDILLDKDKYVEKGLSLQQQAKNDGKKSAEKIPTKKEFVQVKAAAAWALGVFNRKRSITPLIKALEDKETEVRVNAAFALGELADQGEMKEKPKASVANHINSLISKFENENAEVKYRIALSFPILKLLKGADAELKKKDQKIFFYLANTLIFDDIYSRALAIRTIGKLHDIRGVYPLQYTMMRERSHWVNQEIYNALKEIKIFNQFYFR